MRGLGGGRLCFENGGISFGYLVVISPIGGALGIMPGAGSIQQLNLSVVEDP